MKASPCLYALLAGLALLPSDASAAESYDNCSGFIDSLPAVVTTQGVWCLRADLSTTVTSGAAIDIRANNVTLDCNGFKVGGLGAAAGSQAVGVESSGRLNISVENCSVRGFFYGIRLMEGSGHVVRDNRLDATRYLGIQVTGEGSEISRNRILDTADWPGQQIGIGIYTLGGVDVLDNLIDGMRLREGTEYGAVYALVVYGGSAGTIAGNRIRGLDARGGVLQGIFIGFNPRHAVRGNDLVHDGSPGSVGIACSGTGSRVIGNMVNGFELATTYCADAGGNDFTP